MGSTISSGEPVRRNWLADYTLFLHEDGLLVGYLEADNLQAWLAAMATTDGNARLERTRSST